MHQRLISVDVWVRLHRANIFTSGITAIDFLLLLGQFVGEIDLLLVHVSGDDGGGGGGDDESVAQPWVWVKLV